MHNMSSTSLLETVMEQKRNNLDEQQRHSLVKSIGTWHRESAESDSVELVDRSASSENFIGANQQTMYVDNPAFEPSDSD